MQPKMVVDDQYGELISAFLKQFFKVYDSDDREPLVHAYHEQAKMSMSAAFNKSMPDETVTKYYIQDSRNLQKDALKKYPGKRDRLLLQRRTQIVGFLEGLPKTQHDITSFTLDVIVATEVMVSFTVTGTFRERTEKAPIKHFSRMFVAMRQGDGLSIVNDSLFLTHATNEQSKVHTLKIAFSPYLEQFTTFVFHFQKTKCLFAMADKSKMNLEWSKQCLDDQNWDLEKALQAFKSAKLEGKIPKEAYN